MKIGITGHTESLGKFLFEEFSKSNNVVGFSRNNNYDLKDYLKIVEDVNDCDVFINNVYHETNQEKLFESLFTKWVNEPKTIINILTSAVFNGGSLDRYRNSKIKLQQKAIKLINDNYYKKVRVVNIYPNTLENNTKYNFEKVKFKEIYDVINFQLSLPQDLQLTHIDISKTTYYKNNSII